jgi:hypothetical protein
MAFPSKLRLISTSIRLSPGKAGLNSSISLSYKARSWTAITTLPSRRRATGDTAHERRLHIPHSAVIPPSTNGRAPVT